MSETDYVWYSCFSALGWWHFLVCSPSKDRHVGVGRIIEIIILGLFSLVLGFLWPLFIGVLFVSIPNLLDVLDKHGKREEQRK